jgi:hypothetical protein
VLSQAFSRTHKKNSISNYNKYQLPAHDRKAREWLCQLHRAHHRLLPYCPTSDPPTGPNLTALTVGILRGHLARGEVLTFVALPRDKWIGTNAWGICRYNHYTKSLDCHTEHVPHREVLAPNIRISNTNTLTALCVHRLITTQ